MPDRIPFRRMREALKSAIIQTALLLAVEELNWPQTDYALFFVMNQMWEATDNPTYAQMIGQVVAWMRFYKRLLEKLPDDNPLRAAAVAEFHKVSEPYIGLLEVIKPT